MGVRERDINELTRDEGMNGRHGEKKIKTEANGGQLEDV